MAIERGDTKGPLAALAAGILLVGLGCTPRGEQGLSDADDIQKPITATESVDAEVADAPGAAGEREPASPGAEDTNVGKAPAVAGREAIEQSRAGEPPGGRKASQADAQTTPGAAIGAQAPVESEVPPEFNVEAYSFARRADFASDVRGRMKNFDQRLNQIESRMQTSADETSVSSPRELRELEQKTKRVEARIQDAEGVPAAEWEDYKTDIARQIRELEQDYQALQAAQR